MKPISIKEQTVSDESRKILKLLGDIALMELLPKKTVLRTHIERRFIFHDNKVTIHKEKVNKIHIVFTSTKPINKDIKYKTSIVHKVIKDFGFNLPFWMIRDYALLPPIQKYMKNKFYHIDTGWGKRDFHYEAHNIK